MSNVTNGEVCRYFASGPEGSFFTKTLVEAQNLLDLTSFDSDEWTITDLHNATEDAHLVQNDGRVYGLERIDGMEFWLHEDVNDMSSEPVRLVMGVSFGDKVFCHRASQADNGACADAAMESAQ
jgi:hypothetical protein